MGDWTITIRGVGSHHNRGFEHDANRMAAEFVNQLRTVGHTVVSATFATGCHEDLSQPRRYMDDRDAIEDQPRGERCGHPVGDGACRLVAAHEGDHEPPVKWTPL